MTETSIAALKPLDAYAVRRELLAVASALTRLAEALLPQAPIVICPACRQPVTPNPDGTLPGHEINPGPKRSPMCRFRGTVPIGVGA